MPSKSKTSLFTLHMLGQRSIVISCELHHNYVSHTWFGASYLNASVSVIWYICPHPHLHWYRSLYWGYRIIGGYQMTDTTLPVRFRALQDNFRKFHGVNVHGQWLYSFSSMSWQLRYLLSAGRTVITLHLLLGAHTCIRWPLIHKHAELIPSCSAAQCATMRHSLRSVNTPSRLKFM